MDSDADAIRASIRNIIVSIKPLEDGFESIADDDALFRDGSGRPSPVDLDSLDALDLAMSIGDEFNLDNEEFERLVESDEGLQSLRTVNDITELIVSLVKNGDERPDAGDNLRGKEVMA